MIFKLIKLVIRISIIVTILFTVNTFAHAGVSNIYKIEKKILSSDEKKFLDQIEKEINVDGVKYSYSTCQREPSKENEKKVTVYKTDTINSSTERSINEHFGSTFDYKDDSFQGTIDLVDYKINPISQGTHEEISEKNIAFSGYTKNDLNDIEKTKVINRITYYLIAVDWEVDDYEIIDNQQVAINYKGNMNYQTIVNVENPYKYEVTVQYEGIVDRIDPVYTFTLEYTEIPEDETPIIETKTYYKEAAIISGLGIVILSLYLLFSSNAKIYNKTENGYVLLKNCKLSKEKNKIDVSNLEHKISTNMFAIKLNNSSYKKLANSNIMFKKDKVSKTIFINGKFIDFIIG